MAQKLGLGEDKVKIAFDSLHEEKHAEMQKSLEDKLSQAVKDKKITEDQKQKIVTKHKELFEQKQQSKNQNMTPEERRAAMQKLHTEMQSWAKENNIDMQYLFGFGKRVFKFHGMKN